MTESDFHILYEATQQPLRAYIRSITNDSELADDIAQESYIRFLQAKTDALTPVQAKSYLFTIATNLVRDTYRKKMREREWSAEHARLRDEPVSHNEFHLDVTEAFGQLSPQNRALLWLAYVDEYKHKEIAELLKLNDKSVRVLLFRAKEKFLELLRRIGIESEVTDEHS